MSKSDSDDDYIFSGCMNDSITISSDNVFTISTDTVNTESVTLTGGDYTFTIDDTIDLSNLNITNVSTGFGGIEWEDHLPPMSTVKDMMQHYPALAKAYQNFKTVYKMVEQDYKGNHKDDEDVPF